MIVPLWKVGEGGQSLRHRVAFFVLPSVCLYISMFFRLLLCKPISLCVCLSLYPSLRSSFLVPFASLFLYFSISVPCLMSSVSVSLLLSVSASLSLLICPSSSSAPPQVTVGTGLRSPMVPVQGACGSSSSTPRPWAPGPSFSRPSLCTAAPSPRSCCRRSTSSQVGLARLPPLPSSLQDGGPDWSVKPGAEGENFNLGW